MKKKKRNSSRKFWIRFTIGVLLIPVLLFVVVLGIVYQKQDSIVQDLVKTANTDFVGTIKIKDSHISPFASFPYISIDLEGLEVFEGKEISRKSRILNVKDTYVGFDLWTLISGKMDVKSIRLSNGKLRLIQHKDGTFNITNALASKKPTEELKEDFHFDLKQISLDQIDIVKINEETNMTVDAFVYKAKTKLKTNDDGMTLALDTKFKLSIIQDGDTTFLKNKHMNVVTDIHLDETYSLLTIDETEIGIERASFGFKGKVDLKNEMDLDLNFHGVKPNFDLVLAMAPEELIPTLEKFDNKGRIFFEATVKGKSLNGQQPAINANFGCEDGFFNNLDTRKKLDKIAFKGNFTNGKKRNASTSKFEMENFTAKPEAGVFTGKFVMENFDSPEIDMQLKSDFDLDFLSKFLTYRELQGLSGRVALTMNFHDIIDIENPEKSIERLNESYYTELLVENLKFKGNFFHVPLNDLDIRATMKGHQANIEQFNLNVGKSDLKIKGTISDLPAIIHHRDISVLSELNIESTFLDITELTQTKDKKGVDEQIENLRMKLKFKSSAKAMTESPVLPHGEFFIDDFYAKMKHYPHTLHDFHADVFIEENDFKVIDFSGFIDQSDFHFNGNLKNYALWFEPEMRGDTRVEFDLTSSLLQFENLFAYGGENFVPEDYRHEEISGLKLHGITDLHFQNGLKSTDFQLTELKGKMKVHPLKLEQFSGKVHVENEQLSVQKLAGKMGNTSFSASADYFLGKGKGKKKNWISITAPRLDFDQLMNYEEKIAASNSKSIDHDAVFSIYDFEFPELEVNLDVKTLNYHKYLLNQFHAKLRSETNHILHVDLLAFDAAGGHFDIRGYLSGKDKKHIYFNPTIQVKGVDLDKFMVKFDNFGQDHLVSENLHGKFTGKITGKIHLHADLVPKIDDSEIKIDMQVLDGRLVNYAPMLALSDYFQDEKLSNVVFDTLTNVFTLKKSVLEIPRMTINSNLGFLEISGKQNIDDAMNMDYLVGVPWKMVSQVGAQKIFKRKSKNEESPDEIQYRQSNSRLVYVKIQGDLENMKVSLGKKGK